MVLKIKKNKRSYTIPDIYRHFCKDTDVEVPYMQYKAVLQDFNQLILHSLQDAAEGFKMPCGLGYIRIVKYKPKHYNKNSLSIDFKSTREEGKIIYHLNGHSDGYKYRLFWSKLPKTFVGRYKYTLGFTGTNKRRLAQLIFNRQDYIDINDIQIY